jgi:hypothetical protein
MKTAEWDSKQGTVNTGQTEQDKQIGQIEQDCQNSTAKKG